MGGRSDIGVSHNAPYKHFEDRSALLAEVAIQDFVMLTNAFGKIRKTRLKPLRKLRKALETFVAYGQNYPVRYRLLFSDRAIAARGGTLEAAAMSSFTEFAVIVEECKQTRALPQVSTVELAGLIYASVHGLIETCRLADECARKRDLAAC
jgi:AcrR family transcriptional regulator